MQPWQISAWYLLTAEGNWVIPTPVQTESPPSVLHFSLPAQSLSLSFFLSPCVIPAHVSLPSTKRSYFSSGQFSTLLSLLLLNVNDLSGLLSLILSASLLSLRWYPIYPQTKAFYHIATHTQIHTHLASSPLCLAGMLMNEWSLVVIPYLCNLNTDGTPCRVKPGELHLSLTTEPSVFTPWHPSEVSGCLSSVDYGDRNPQSPACPRECPASFIFALWGIFLRLNGFFILFACNETQTACRDNAG